MGKIFFLMGKSCSGKDTIYKKLLLDDILNLREVVGYTTRPIRSGEEEGKEYFFVTRETLTAYQEAGKVIECRDYDTVYGIWSYFTVDDGQIELEKGNYLYIGTLDSYLQVKKYYGSEAVVPLYVEVEDGLRLERALARERKQEVPKYEEMCRRFLADQKDFSDENIKKAGIVMRYQNNGMLEDCYESIFEAVWKQM